MPPTSTEVIRRLLKEGWRKKSQKGSHIKLVWGEKMLIIPRHNRELKSGTWEAIKKQAGWK